MDISAFLQNRELLESFDIGSKPIRNTLNKTKQILREYLIQKYSEDIVPQMIDTMLNSYKEVLVFDIKEPSSERYIVFLFKSENVTEVHFNNFKKVDYYLKTKEENTPQKVLSSIFNIMYWYCLGDLENIELQHESFERLALYEKIAIKIVKKYNMPYSVIRTNNSIKLNHLENNLTERFLV